MGYTREYINLLSDKSNYNLGWMQAGPPLSARVSLLYTQVSMDWDDRDAGRFGGHVREHSEYETFSSKDCAISQ